MKNLKELGNNQLGLYYKKIEQDLNCIQKEILQQILDIFKKIPHIDYITYNEPKKFKEVCLPYRQKIEEKNKKKFIETIQEQEELKQEIKIRQKNMLKKIKARPPSLQTQTITEGFEPSQLAEFEKLIEFIKCIQEKKGHTRPKEKKGHTRPKEKKIYLPEKITNKFSILGIITTLTENLGPTPN